MVLADDRSKSGPIGVVLRLAALSLIVGVVLSALGITAANFVDSLNLLARRIYELGFGAFGTLAQYMFIGALLVVPVWAISWLLRRLNTRRD